MKSTAHSPGPLSGGGAGAGAPPSGRFGGGEGGDRGAAAAVKNPKVVLVSNIFLFYKFEFCLLEFELL